MSKKEALECIQQSLDSKVLSIEIPGRILKKYKIHKNFGIIATTKKIKHKFSNEKKAQEFVFFQDLIKKI